jgi:hypothetical protein
VKRRVAVLISGRGSNMMSLLAAAADPAYPATIALVLSNQPDAEGLGHAGGKGAGMGVQTRESGQQAGVTPAPPRRSPSTTALSAPIAPPMRRRSRRRSRGTGSSLSASLATCAASRPFW